MAASGANALETRFASAFSFGVRHLLGWDYFQRRISARGVKGGRLHTLWNVLIHITAGEWMAGIIVGVVLTVILDLVSPNSHIRAGIRYLRNVWSEHSEARLEKRIGDMERYRDNLKMYLVSDKAHYLGTLRYMLAVLIFIAIGFSILTLGHMEPFVRLIIPGSFDLMALACFAFAIIVGFVGANISSPDYQSKIQDMITKAESDIEKLRETLARMQG